MDIIKKKKNNGQSLVEYVVLIAMIVSSGSILVKPMKNLLDLLEKPIRVDFKYIYTYGDPKACGREDNEDHCQGTPVRHARINAPENFRMVGRGKQ
jgi:hypothetical protein